MKRLFTLFAVILLVGSSYPQSGSSNGVASFPKIPDSTALQAVSDFFKNRFKDPNRSSLTDFELRSNNNTSRVDFVQFFSQALQRGRNMMVYYPLGYETTQLPVIYFLHGAGGDHESYVWYMKPILDRLISGGKIDPMIVVFPDGGIPLVEIDEFLGRFFDLNVGSFYTNSALYGAFEDYIAQDVVEYIDSHYNTIPHREGRILMGHSMGGFGSMKLAFKHPEIFRGAASHSGPLDLSQLPVLVPRILNVLPGPPYSYFPVINFSPIEFDTLTVLALMMAGAFSPNPSANFFLPVDFPLDANGEIIDAVFAKWQDHNPARFAKRLHPYSDLALYIDCGKQDQLGIFPLNTAFADTLAAFGILHKFLAFDGDHSAKLYSERLEISLAFINSILKTQALPARLVFLADEEVRISKMANSEGTIHSNGEIDFKSGANTVHRGNLIAAGRIEIEKKNTIQGTATSGSRVKNSGTVTELPINEFAHVAPIPLPRLSFKAGGKDVTVRRRGKLALAPGSYGEVEVDDYGILQLRNGKYFMEELKAAEFAVLEMDVSAGPIAINVKKKTRFDKFAQVAITPTGEMGSNLVTFNCSNDDDFKIAEGCRIFGTIVAPRSEVSLAENVRFKGMICAKDIKIDEGVTYLPHESPSALPKAAPMERTTDSEITTVPSEFKLLQNYPNPFNPSTTIAFELPQPEQVSLKIFNALGQEVATLVDKNLPAGNHHYVWNAGGLAGGLYFYRLQAGSFAQTKKLVLFK